MKLRHAILCALALLTGNVAFAGLLDDVKTADEKCDAEVASICTVGELKAKQSAWLDRGLAAIGGKPIPLVAQGWDCIAAAHAYAAEPQLFSEVRFTNPPPSWTDMVKDPAVGRESYAVSVWGALEEYDWTDLVEVK